METERRNPHSRESVSGTCDTGCCRPRLVPGLSERKAVHLAAVLKAMADPTRLRIVSLLAEQEGSACVCDIVATFPLGQPTISHHLRVLRETGLVDAEKRGLWVHYRLNRATWAELEAVLRTDVFGEKEPGGEEQ